MAIINPLCESGFSFLSESSDILISSYNQYSTGNKVATAGWGHFYLGILNICTFDYSKQKIMASYEAKSGNSLSFDITKGDLSIGNLSYKSWFKFNAVITLAGNAA